MLIFTEQTRNNFIYLLERQEKKKLVPKIFAADCVLTEAGQKFNLNKDDRALMKYLATLMKSRVEIFLS